MEIRIATTPEEKQAIYELRYQCLIEEMGWRYEEADGERRHLQDAADDAATLYYACVGECVVATCRLHFGDVMIDDETRERFSLHLFKPYPIACHAFIFKLVVLAEYRGSTVMIRLLQRCYEDGWKHGTRISFCYCRPRLVEIYERLGFMRYKDNIMDQAQGYMAPMVMLNEDVDHFRAVRSPFLRICQSQNVTLRETAQWFDQTFPGARHSTGKQTMTAEEFVQQWAQAMDARTAALLNGFSPDQIQKLLMAGTVLQCRAGDELLREGEAGHEMFLIIEGTARITAAKAGAEESLIGLLAAGETFGELALVSRAMRSASIRAQTDMQVLVISQEFLQSAMRAMPDVAIKLLYNLAAVLGDKLRATTERMLDALAEKAALSTSVGLPESVGSYSPSHASAQRGSVASK
jgi:CRP-like cAMP-binding protein/predicted GNAT family N-acyltransferase